MLLAAAALAALPLLSGCTDHDGGTVPGSFAGKATDTCIGLAAGVKSHPPFPFAHFDPMHPDPKKLPKIGAFYQANGWPVATDAKEALHGLGEPNTGRRRWDAFLAQFDRYVSTVRNQMVAATRADGHSYTVTAVQFRDMLPAVETAATAAGVPRCSPFHLGKPQAG